MRTLMIDNYDSFTYNLYQYLWELGTEVTVYRNDAVTVEECIAFDPDNIVISPGPGDPKGAGISMDVIRAFAGKKPILGVCLGHQSICEVYGGVVTHAGEVVHGKTAEMIHDNQGVFAGLPANVTMTRYHSLACDPKTVPDELVVTARTANGIIQGVRHRKYKIEGVQFHPESVLSNAGKQLLQNFLNFKESGN